VDRPLKPGHQAKTMNSIFSCNICRTGRLMRGLISLALFVAAGFAFAHALWLGIVLALLGIFSLLEALCGWCILRACGIKTKL